MHRYSRAPIGPCTAYHALFSPAIYIRLILSSGILMFVAAGIPAASYIEKLKGQGPAVVVIVRLQASGSHSFYSGAHHPGALVGSSLPAFSFFRFFDM